MATAKTNNEKTTLEIINEWMALNKPSTSQIIRYVANEMAKTISETDPTKRFQMINNATYKFIKMNLPSVTTKNGGEIRYQHVRGVMKDAINKIG